jgi:hypothetical protein
MRDFFRKRRRQIRPPSEGHLTEDDLNRYLDEHFPVDEQPGLASHLSRCPECRERLEQLRATVRLLRNAPQMTPRISFRIAPQDASPQSKWDRLLSRLVPGTPALRVATVGVFVLLLTVTATDRLSDDGAEPPRANRPVIQSTSISSTGQEEEQPRPNAAREESQPIGDESASEAQAPAAAPTTVGESNSEAFTQDEEIPATGGRTQSQATGAPASAAMPEPASSDVVSQIESPAATPIAEATEIASQVASQTDQGKGGVSGWRVTEVLLLIVFTWLAVTWFARSRFGSITAEK